MKRLVRKQVVASTTNKQRTRQNQKPFNAAAIVDRFQKRYPKAYEVLGQ